MIFSMSGFTITYDNYKFDIELTGSQTNIKLTNTDHLDLYEALLKRQIPMSNQLKSSIQCLKNH